MLPLTVTVSDPITTTLLVPLTPNVMLDPVPGMFTFEVPLEIAVPLPDTTRPVRNAPLPIKYVALTLPPAAIPFAAVILPTPRMSLLVNSRLSPLGNS